MATTTFHEYDGNGSTLTFNYTFPTIKKEDVKVRVNDVLVDNFTIPSYATSGTKTVTFDNTTGTVNSTVCESSGAPKAGTANVYVYRDTDVDARRITYNAGSSIKADDLNSQTDQLLYADQEEQNQLITTSRVKDGAVTRVKIAADAIDGTKIADDVINSEHYVAGSIDLEHMSANSVDSDQYVDGSIDLVHMSANSVDSDQYVDGSIDLIHLSANSVDSSKIVDGSIVNADINASAAIAGSKLAASTTSAAGSMSAADKTKLDGIETGATADQTNAEIRAAVEAASDSNVFTDADHTKLNAIEANADVTDATNVNAAGAVMNSDLDGKGEILVGDGSGDPTPLPVGTNDYILTADSSAATGVKWAANAGAAGGSGATEAFKTISVSGQNNVVADSATDTLTFAAGSNITLTTNDSTDTVTIAASGGEVTVQDEGSSLSTAATTLNFVGAGVTASGTGATKTITISGGGGATSTDFKYLELKAHNNASGAFSAGAADYELVTKGTTTAITPSQAAALIISIGGVIQEPNTGTSIGSNTGFCIDGSSIHFGANLVAHPDFIIYLQGAGVATIGDNTVTGAKIALGSDAAGDIMYYNGTDYVRLAKGTAGQMLQVNSGATAPEWAAPPSGTTNLTNTANGTSLTVESSSGNNTSLPAATTSAWGVMTDEDKTKLDGIATGATATPTTTRGDIIYRGASADARLAKGTAGQYLKQGANDPEWADVVGAVADGCIFENDQTISNNYTIASGKGAHSVGPITVNATVTVNGNWVVS